MGVLIMKSKKIIENTIGITVGSVGISEANKITPYGNVIGTTMGAGLLAEVGGFNKKKKGGF